MRMRFLAGAALSIAALGLAACGEQPAQETETAPEAAPGVTVANGRLILPAVKGNPGVVYFDLTNNSDTETAIAGVSVQGAAAAMLHATTMKDGVASMDEMTSVPVAKGATVSFAPGGNHVMAMELGETLAAGGSTEVTLTFEGGDKLSFPVEIRAAGDDR